MSFDLEKKFLTMYPEYETSSKGQHIKRKKLKNSKNKKNSKQSYHFIDKKINESTFNEGLTHYRNQ